MSYVESSETRTLGGTSGILDFNKWVTTVDTNSIPIYIELDWTPFLLDKNRFPNDPDIGNKKENFIKGIAKYAISPLYCYNNCSGNGECVSDKYFNMGKCNCKNGFAGIDCSEKVDLRVPIYQGSICGYSVALNIKQIRVINNIPQPPYAESYNQYVNNECDGLNVDKKCPLGYEQKIIYKLQDIVAGNEPDYLVDRYIVVSKFCSKQTNNSEPSPIGSICGISNGVNHMPCDNHNPYISCPSGYAQYKRNLQRLYANGRVFYTNNMAFCWKNLENIPDYNGSICGMATEQDNWICGSNNPSSVTKPCPKDYMPFSMGGIGLSGNLRLCHRNIIV